MDQLFKEIITKFLSEIRLENFLYEKVDEQMKNKI